MKKTRSAIVLFLASFVLYAAMNYGGIRSPDSEVVFRVAESLESSGSFEVREQLEGWKGFGVARGVDGRLYAIFGPAESVVSVPFIRVARWIGGTAGYRWDHTALPMSHYVDEGLPRIMLGKPATEPDAHWLRLVASFLNSFVTALSVVVFWRIARLLTSSPAAAGFVSVLYAFGSLAWPYSGTFFSEPLATLFSLISLLLLVYRDAHRDSGGWGTSPIVFLAAGLSLGVAVSAHITAILFAPFFAAYASASPGRTGRDVSYSWKPATFFAAGLVAIGIVLAYYNYARFGNILETGRSVGDDGVWTNKYAHFVAPWQGLGGLLFSRGKSIFLFCPAVILGIVGWKRFHTRWRLLSWTIAAAALSRLVFVACRSDWHGGFSLGPRYLVMLVPFLLLPATVWVEHLLESRKRLIKGALAGLGLVCVWQQLYFCLGEVFTYLHAFKLGNPRLRIDDAFFVEWRTSPLHGLLGGRRGPFLMQNVDLSNQALWIVCCVLTLAIAAAWVFSDRLRKKARG
jgi:hypothetical protein